MFAGLMSRWITPMRCEYSNALSMPSITCAASRCDNGPFTRMMSRRVCPFTYSITTYGRRSDWPFSSVTISSPES